MERDGFVSERKLLQAILLVYLCQSFHEEFGIDTQAESYAMDVKVIQHMLRELVSSGQYTLEGISFHTHIPFDVILDAAVGRTEQFFVTSWVRVVQLYIQMKPEMCQKLAAKLLEAVEQHPQMVGELLKG